MDERPDPTGGQVTVNTDIRTALGNAATVAQLDQQNLVNLRLNTTTRTSDVRDNLLAYGFAEDDDNADAPAVWLATRLAKAMDNRSKACLLVTTAYRLDDRRRLTIWIFPKEEALQFATARGGARRINLLTDIFSQTSNLRKAALFEGRNLRTDFIEGRVLDSQAHASTLDIADFWIGRFLDAELAIQGEAGTRILAGTIRKAYESLREPDEREQMHAAIIAIRHSPQQRWTLRQFSNRYLQGHVKDMFLNSAPNPDSLQSAFDFDKGVFDKTLNYRIFQLDSGVYVSSPFDEVGRSVRVSAQERRLACEGTIVQEKVATRRA